MCSAGSIHGSMWVVAWSSYVGNSAIIVIFTFFGAQTKFEQFTARELLSVGWAGWLIDKSLFLRGFGVILNVYQLFVIILMAYDVHLLFNIFFNIGSTTFSCIKL